MEVMFLTCTTVFLLYRITMAKIIIAIKDPQVHVSTCIGHLQVIVKHNEVLVIYLMYMTAVGAVVFVVDCVACSVSVFLGLCFWLSVIVLSKIGILMMVWLSSFVCVE